MLIECGFVRVRTGNGEEFSFTPSFRRLTNLGNPHEIVEIFSLLHGPDAAAAATDVLACLCDQDDATALIGWRDENGRHAGLMPAGEKIILARHLMQHGIAGNARPGGKGAAAGKFSATFDAAEYVAAAMAHLGLSRTDAESLSMTEFQKMFEMKFPDAGKKERDVPTREEYRAAMQSMKGPSRG